MSENRISAGSSGENLPRKVISLIRQAIAFTSFEGRTGPYPLYAMVRIKSLLATAYERRAPHVVAEHAFALARAFSSFYESCSILNEPAPEIRRSRLSLASAVLRQLELSLNLLGVQTVERM